METMKIADQRGTSTRFDNIDVGSYFYDADETAAHRLELKVPAGKDEYGSPCNAVCLNTGKFVCVPAETCVQAVEINVLSNVQGRST
jgi:hypothetical protein